jgi:radical SAM protein with 4Fe4S-binding SPASM domain
MCWFHGTNGIGDRYSTSEMTTGEILGLINQLAVYRPDIYIGGAEPLVRDDFVTIAKCVKNFRLPMAFTTNGTLLGTEINQCIVALGIENLNLSIDGPIDIHDNLRGPGVFRRVIDNLNELLSMRRATGKKNPTITINVTISPLVVGRLQETIESILDETGNQIDAFRIHHLWFITPTELQVHHAAVREELDRLAPGACAHRIPFIESINSTMLSNELSKLKGREKVTFFPDLYGRECRTYYSDGYQARKSCGAPFRAIVVKPNGDVRFCPDEWIDDYVLGNIRKDRFESIWSSARAAHFRSVILRRGSFPGCQRCSWMHCF